jgi:hypothetical protein
LIKIILHLLSFETPTKSAVLSDTGVNLSAFEQQKSQGDFLVKEIPADAGISFEMQKGLIKSKTPKENHQRKITKGKSPKNILWCFLRDSYWFHFFISDITFPHFQI